MDSVFCFVMTPDSGRPFSSRWWGVVSTVYLFTSVILLIVAWNIQYSMGSTIGLFMKLVALVAPLLLGFPVASAIESGRSPEPPLELFDDRLLRGLRIFIGFLLPLLFAAVGEILAALHLS